MYVLVNIYDYLNKYIHKYKYKHINRMADGSE